MTGIVPNSPAEKLGLKKDDILIGMGEKSLESAADFDARVRAVKEPVALTLIRAGRRIKLNIEPEEAPWGSREEFYLGIPVGTVDDVLRAHLDIPAGQGLVVQQVQPDSPAARAGLEPHDILLSVGGHPVADVKALRERVQESGGKPISLSVVRKAKPLTLEVTPMSRKAPIVPELDYYPLPGFAGAAPRNWAQTDPFGLYFVGAGAVLDQDPPHAPAASGNAPPVGPTTPMLRWVVVQPPTPADEPPPKWLDEVMKQLEQTNRSLAELKALHAKDGKETGAGGGPRD